MNILRFFFLNPQKKKYILHRNCDCTYLLSTRIVQKTQMYFSCHISSIEIELYILPKYIFVQKCHLRSTTRCLFYRLRPIILKSIFTFSSFLKILVKFSILFKKTTSAMVFFPQLNHILYVCKYLCVLRICTTM